jgi:hypothetical protein
MLPSKECLGVHNQLLLNVRGARSLARARAESEALEARAAAAEGAEAAAAAEARRCEAAAAERDAVAGRCDALEARLSEMRAEQARALLRRGFAQSRV